MILQNFRGWLFEKLATEMLIIISSSVAVSILAMKSGN